MHVSFERFGAKLWFHTNNDDSCNQNGDEEKSDTLVVTKKNPATILIDGNNYICYPGGSYNFNNIQLPL